jgi:preprotein translocase subunit SecD
MTLNMKMTLRLPSVCFIALMISVATSSLASVFEIRRVGDEKSDDMVRMEIVRKYEGRTTKEMVYVARTNLLDETALKSAREINNEGAGEPAIRIVFNAAGKDAFAQVTRENVGKRLAIFVDGRLRCAPNIMTEIRAGVGEITGGFSEQEAKDLATKINEAIKNH